MEGAVQAHELVVPRQHAVMHLLATAAGTHFAMRIGAAAQQHAVRIALHGGVEQGLTVTCCMPGGRTWQSRFLQKKAAFQVSLGWETNRGNLKSKRVRLTGIQERTTHRMHAHVAAQHSP